ncbi:FG-GAP repeat protein (plasmid) [Deinococcus sp. KNUC1210]|nr:FG-GAP repeat protein [Deinococcus sp. KNUC1210]ULH17934.1 FG-GAP repeat protein [Deinococcus sp. KNUC1210]
MTYKIEARPTGVTLGDVNGDGRLDVVITASFMSVLIKN